MKLQIFYNGEYEDSFVIEGDTIEEIREKVKQETNKRGWKEADCWSEKLQ